MLWAVEEDNGMLRDVMSAVNYSLCAEIALVIFALAFVGMVISTLCWSRRETDSYAAIPLSDRVETPRDE